MKKLLLSGIAVVALASAGTAQAGGLSINGETGLARTPIAATLAPMTFAAAVDYVASDATFVPVRAEIGLPYGFEVGGAYDYLDIDADPTIWSLNAKWALPAFVENLGIAVGGHYFAQDFDNFNNDGHDLYAVATYTVPMGEGMAILPSFGVNWLSLTGDNEDDAVRFFGSVIFKAPMFAVGGEYMSTDEDVDGVDDGSYWFGGRFFLNPMITFQAGYLNNVNWNDGEEDFSDGVFHVGAQFAFSSGN